MLAMADPDHDRSQSLAEFRVRAARAADAAAIGEAHAEAWRRAYGAVFDLENSETAVEHRRNTGTTLTRQLGGTGSPQLVDGSSLLLVEAAGVVVGFAHFGSLPAEDPQPEIYALYVHPESWGTGAAQALWSETVAALEGGAASPIVLWTLEGATRARRFYERRGWVPTGHRREHDFGIGQLAIIVQYRSPERDRER